MKYTITALPAVAALIIAQSALGAAIPACENGCDGNDGNDDPAASSSVAYANPMKTNYHPTVGGAESPCDTCPQELPTGTNEDEDCSDTKLYQIHPVADASLCIAVQIDIDGKVDGSKLVHLEPCDRRPLQRNWNLQTIKGDISNGSLHGPTLMRLEDSQWCLDTTSSTPENGWIPHLYNCSEPTAPWLQQDWYIGEYNQLQIHDPASGNKTCLDVEYGDLDARVLQTWECDPNGANQHQAWTITEATVTVGPEPMFPHMDRD